MMASRFAISLEGDRKGESEGERDIKTQFLTHATAVTYR